MWEKKFPVDQVLERKKLNLKHHITSTAEHLFTKKIITNDESHFIYILEDTFKEI